LALDAAGPVRVLRGRFTMHGLPAYSCRQEQQRWLRLFNGFRASLGCARIRCRKKILKAWEIAICPAGGDDEMLLVKEIGVFRIDLAKPIELF
jgi:hypothetical protein